MLSSICCMRRCILALVKLRSRLFTALYLLPSMVSNRHVRWPTKRAYKHVTRRVRARLESSQAGSFGEIDYPQIEGQHLFPSRSAGHRLGGNRLAVNNGLIKRGGRYASAYRGKASQQVGNTIGGQRGTVRN